MRQFKLYNSIGKYYDLNSIESFFHDPEGLGFENDAEYERIGSQFLRTESGMKQPEPSGKIRFIDYKTYNEFSKFLQNQPLRLEYTAAGTYYMNVNVKKIKKTELEAMGLIVEIEFSGLGPWYLDLIKYMEDSSLMGKIYDYEYPYTYADSTQGIIRIDSDSEIESPLKITAIGPVYNLMYTHYLNGKVIATGKVNYDLPEGHRLQISSQMPYSIKELDNIGTEVNDLYQCSDFSTERFLWIKKGVNEIFFSHGGSEKIKVVAEALIYYDSV